MRSVDSVTVVAIAITAAVATLLDHELLGHGIACVLAGGHFVQLTSINQTWNGDVGPVATRLVTLAGIASNIFWGIVALLGLRALPQADPRLRYFLWFFGHLTLFMGSGYLMSSSLFGFGDMAAVLRGLPNQLVWTIIAAIAGIAIYRATLLDAAPILDAWAGDDERPRRLRALSLLPWLAAGTVVALSGFANPPGVSAGFWWSAGPILGAGLGFGYLPLVVRRREMRNAVLVLPRSLPWVGVGIGATLVLFFILAPGVPR